MQNQSRNGGQVLVQQLVNQGARNVFLVPGESYLPCIDAFNEHKETIIPIVCRQESGAAYMAEAYGKITNEPGICFVTRGPGATNAAVGVHTAYQDSTPMILFIGQVGKNFIDREAFQEIDYTHLFGKISKWVAQIDSTERIPEYIARAYNVATSGRPGPVVLALPEDILWGKAQVADVKKIEKVHSYPSVEQLQEFKQKIEKALSPFLLVGGSGWTTKAQENLIAFANRFKLPVGVSWRRLECFDHNQEQFVGHVGSGMYPKLREKLKQSDLIIALGTRLNELTTEGYNWITPPTPKQQLIHIYPDPEELGRVYQPDLSIVSDVVGFSTSLTALHPSRPPSWMPETQMARKNYLSSLQPLKAPGALSLDEISHCVSKILNGRGCITVGAGNYALYPHRYAHYSGLGSSLTPTVGTMGYGLPAALSNKLIFPNKPTICFAGDGCFQMNLQELGVAQQYSLGIVILVFNNGMWGTIRAHQEREFPTREIALTFTNPKYQQLIEAYGGYGQVIDKTEDFEKAFRSALDFTEKEKLPALIELRYDPNGIAPGETLDKIKKNSLKAVS